MQAPSRSEPKQREISCQVIVVPEEQHPHSSPWITKNRPPRQQSDQYTIAASWYNFLEEVTDDCATATFLTLTKGSSFLTWIDALSRFLTCGDWVDNKMCFAKRVCIMENNHSALGRMGARRRNAQGVSTPIEKCNSTYVPRVAVNGTHAARG